jgi:single-stranded-DNA-specific exonuclease
MPGLPPIIAQLLFNRGITASEEVEPFLIADSRLSSDPFLLPDMEAAVARIYRAVLGAEKIAIYGDFDADGITSTALLVNGLSSLTPYVIPYIPHRINEGHGLKVSALEGLKQQGVSLVITVDCGVTGVIPVKKAQRLGIDVIITDHHVPAPELPEAVAVIDPKCAGSRYPFIELAGVGVAYKLLQAVLTGLGKAVKLKEITDLVAVGTVADMTPLLGENRYLVKEGLLRMNESLRLGFKEILARAGMAEGKLSAENITWTIAPRLNTAGRLDHALPSYDLITTSSKERAQELAQWLEVKNGERQQLTAQASTKAKQKVVEAGITSLLMVGDEEYPAGISGLIASRLTEEFYRPAVVVRSGKRVTSGSCRSIPEFNIVEALTQCQDLFLEFGGHARAAGFVMLSHNIGHLKERLMKIADEQLAGVDLRPRINIDVETGFRDQNSKAFEYLQKLAPFGQGNPLPVFVTRKVRVVNCRTMGATGDHLRLKLEQNGEQWDAVGFGCGANMAEINGMMDFVYTVEMDQWSGKSQLRLNIQDFAPST